MRIYREGDTGAEIADIQQRLAALGADVPPDESGRFGEATLRAVRAFQVRRSLRVDGLVGPDTWGQLVEASFLLGDRTLYLHAPHMRGDDARDLQRKLNALGFDAGREDGVFGPATDRAVREFQRNVGEAPDGVVGLHTIETIDRMRPIEGAPSRAVVREGEQLRSMTARLEGHVIAIDPGDEPDDLLSAAVDAMVASIEAAKGRPAVLGGAGGRTPSQRAREANDLGAALCISWRVDPEPSDHVPACSYFGSASTHSPAGELLARSIAAELERAFGVAAMLQGLTVAMLRETRMPAVQVEPAGMADATRLGRAVAAGVRRFYGEPGD